MNNKLFSKMGKILSFILVVVFTTLSASTYAQLGKKEMKAWKKRLKSLTPAQYKNLLDDNKSFKNQVGSLKGEISNAESELAKKDKNIKACQSQVAELRTQLTASNKKPVVTEKRESTRPSNDYDAGVVFKVQIGAFSQLDITKFSNSTENFSVDESGGLYRYSIGVFRDYSEADTFKKYIREMGIEEAWVVSYRDGQRVPLNDVISE